jgi:hypothetical protein
MEPRFYYRMPICPMAEGPHDDETVHDFADTRRADLQVCRGILVVQTFRSAVSQLTPSLKAIFAASL